MSKPKHFLTKIPTHIAGFDELAEGGLPKGRAVVVSGAAGSGKTIFGLEFLYRGITEFREPGVFVTFEERREDLLAETSGFGWDLAGLERQGTLVFVDASRVAENQVEVGEYDFGALIARIRYAIKRCGARRCTIDSIGSLFLRYRDAALVRRELFKIIAALRELDVTTVITAERVSDSDTVSRFGVEDFVADSVIYLYNTPVGRGRERQIEVTKLRGGTHQTGKYPLLISNEGLTVFPRESEAFAEDSPTVRISVGVPGLDRMLDGGVYRGSTTLLLGPSGTGRTVLGLHFIAAGLRKRERGLMVSFEEGRAQLLTDAKSIGLDFATPERQKSLRFVAWPAEAKPIEYYLKRLKEIVVECGPRRVVIDSLTPLANAVDEQRFRRFILSLNSFLKRRGITTIVNYTTGSGMGAALLAESDVAVIADNIVTMRFEEQDGRMDRALLIAKSRASAHDKTVRHYDINDSGLIVPDDTPRRPARRRS